jgi:DnaJ like chaperone protein
MGKFTEFASWAEKTAKNVKDLFKPTMFVEVLQAHPSKMKDLAAEAVAYKADWRFMVIAAAGKLCKADGAITKNEIQAMDDLFKLLEFTGEDRAVAIELFNAAKSGLLTFAETIIAFKDYLKPDADTIFLMLAALYPIAHANGPLSKVNHTCLEDACRILNVPFAAYMYQLAEIQKNRISWKEAYTILGCTPDDSIGVIKDRYRTLVKDFHPDTIASKALPDEFTKFSEEKFKKIQGAYEAIMRERGEK